jgi:NAD(P)-dependent dehydrogenase (short-subunit alcohol dehydrogenase family)
MREAWTKSWDVNVISTHVITHRFIPLLLESDDPRLVFLASGTSSLANTESPRISFNAVPPKGWPKPSRPMAGMPAYRSAKTGLTMMMRCV